MTIEGLAEQYAKEYVDTIYGPANAWGQCVHPTLGRSDHIMGRIFDMVSREQGDRKSTRLNSSHVSESRMPSSA